MAHTSTTKTDRVDPQADRETVVVVSDAHLGHTPGSDSERAFQEFLARVPDLGDHLVVNGDLFEFWFEYRSVIPRNAFPTLARLATVRASGVRLTVTGGNHDRWGETFWERELGAVFFRAGAELTLAGHRAWVHHGDGLIELHRGARIMHAVTRHPLTAKAFRLLHPDFGHWLVRRMSRTLGESTRQPAVTKQAADVQREYAHRVMTKRPDLDLLILGHTHMPALQTFGPGRWYLNPGAWMVDRCYATITTAGPELRTFPV